MTTQHNTIEELKKGKPVQNPSIILVFDRIGIQFPSPQAYVFDRLGVSSQLQNASTSNARGYVL